MTSTFTSCLTNMLSRIQPMEISLDYTGSGCRMRTQMHRVSFNLQSQVYMSQLLKTVTEHGAVISWKDDVLSSLFPLRSEVPGFNCCPPAEYNDSIASCLCTKENLGLIQSICRPCIFQNAASTTRKPTYSARLLLVSTLLTHWSLEFGWKPPIKRGRSLRIQVDTAFSTSP